MDSGHSTDRVVRIAASARDLSRRIATPISLAHDETMGRILELARLDSIPILLFVDRVSHDRMIAGPPQRSKSIGPFARFPHEGAICLHGLLQPFLGKG